MTQETLHHRVLIIGSGPAGYTAALYASRANLKPAIVAGHEPGGQLMITTDAENYPGFADVIQGPWLMEQMKEQVTRFGTTLYTDYIKDVDFTVKPFVCKAESGKIYTADAVIVATGAQAKWLGLPTEEKFRGFGVSGCATCDGFFYRGKPVAVIGGGNTAVEEALYLTNFASRVTLVHRRDTLRAEKILQDRLFKNPKIEILWNHGLEEVVGTENPLSVTGLRLKNTQTGATQILDVHGVFIAIGHAPATSVFQGKLATDNEGYLIVKPGTAQTNVEGVFAAGDVHDKIYRQAVTAAGMGCMAALEAERYLAGQE